jgi:chemotaxis-related protein WspD
MRDDCWNDIGVWSETTPSCPRLAEVIHCQNCDVFARAGRGLLDRAAPAGHLEAWSEELARAKDSVAADDRLSLFVFRVGNEWLALPMSTVKEVAEPLPVRTLPRRSGGLLAGLVNVRGELHLAFSMTMLLGVEAGENNPSSALRAPSPLTRGEGSRGTLPSRAFSPRGGEKVPKADEWRRSPEVKAVGLTGEDAGGPHAYPRTIVIGDDDGRWVFPADEAWGILSASTAALGEVPVTIARDSAAHVRGILEWERGKISCLDEKLLFATLQRRATLG